MTHPGLHARDASPADSTDSHVPRSGRPSRLSLKNWRVRSRLLLLVAIPSLAALVLGGIHIYSSAQSALTYQNAEERAVLASAITGLAQRLESERDQTVYYIALGSAGRGGALDTTASRATKSGAAQQYRVVQAYYQQTSQAAAQVRAELARFRGSYSSVGHPAVVTALAGLNSLPYLRHAATQSMLPSLVVIQKYADLIDALIVVDDQTAQGTGDPVLSQTVGVLGMVSRMKEAASEQRAILAAALLQSAITPAQISALNAAQASQQSSQQAFDLAATAQQREQWNASVSGSFINLVASEEQQAITLQARTHSLAGNPTTVDGFYTAMSNGIDNQMGSVERALAADVIARSNSLRSSAVASAILVAALVFIVFALVIASTLVVGRSMVRALRKLQAGALDVAGSRLPETVRRLSEGGTVGLSPQVEPIDVDSRDEIGEVARAFDQVHGEAVRLAANEAALRGNVNAMFVNLSRRSQSLVERQIHLIDDLEQGEQDSERLGSLFRLDHLATRMRRNSENLLVLAGHEAARRWTQPVALVDVLRAAVSEIEHYERIVLSVQPGIAVRGQVVNDVVHLLAELVENATAFSSAQTQVNVSAHLLNSGGVLLDITDQGVGMAADEMAEANWRLDNPPVVDVAVSRRMGLFVVARLASRHGIRVRLRPAASGGLTALIWLPDETITHEEADQPGGPWRFEPEIPATGQKTSGLQQFTSEEFDGRAAAQAALAAARAPRFTAADSDATDVHPAISAHERVVQGLTDDQLLAGGVGSPSTGASEPPPAGDGESLLAEESLRSLSGGDEPAARPGDAQAPARAEGLQAEPGAELDPLPRREGLPRQDDGLPMRRSTLARGEGLLPGDGLPGSDKLPARGDESQPEPGTSPLPRRGDNPLANKATGSFPGWDKVSSPDLGNGSAPDGDAQSQPDPDSAASPDRDSAPVFGAPISGLANGHTAAGAEAADGLPGDEGGSLPGLESSPGLGSVPGLRSRPGLYSSPGAAGPDTFAAEVKVPSVQPSEESRLPIFESVESDWFRRGRRQVSTGEVQAPGAGPEIADAWSSVADEGWRAAQAAESPTSGGVTSAGLPKRIPRANLVPGGVATEAERMEPPGVARSAAATRERMTSFQRGTRRGRAALGGEDASGEEDADAP